ncbi:uncharacterized protein N7506_011914 [Penicillium brevicompactum]|uniref:uncharacterized protein n=1 Tax=Penicillium brevicompactum TaxID=5074 RepID=UPI0025416CA7|nr:uncharacterized protein N7506_011914 [Penicillium brevicompactum]KAJ5319210.1 hypothetical protein N7506_011914 [Penicillium brevicompactum]
MGNIHPVRNSFPQTGQKGQRSQKKKVLKAAAQRVAENESYFSFMAAMHSAAYYGRIVRDRAGLTIRGGCGGGRGSGLGAGRFDSCTLLLGDHRALNFDDPA